VDRRLNERYQANFEVTVVDLAAHGRAASGRIVDVSESGVCSDLSLSFAVGTTVKVQVGDCALFGYVTYSTDAGMENHAGTSAEGQPFRTGIEVVRVLIGESDLARLVNAILLETMPATPGVKVAST